MKKPFGYWTFDKCREEALKYNSRYEFKNNCGSAYTKSLKKCWLDKICSHMVSKQKPCGYWNYENCKDEALKYKYRNEFKKYSGGAFNSSRINGWLDEICSHMLIIGNKQERCIYVYEFDDNSAYVGLTYNINKRNGEHLSEHDSQVFKHIKETNITPVLKQLTDYIDVNDAVYLEKFYEQEYKDNNWNVLNIAKTGSIGGCVLKWTFELSKGEALKYECRSDFKKGSVGAYESCLRNGWLEDVCSHMVEIKKPNGYWTLEMCKLEALKYNKKLDFRVYVMGAYESCLRNGWLEDVCSHMVEIKKPKGHWTFETCKEEALKYNSRNEFKYNSGGAFDKAYDNNWIEDICSHMIEIKKTKGYWDYKNCKEESLKYKNRSEFKKLCNGAWDSSKRNDWLEDFFPKIISEHNFQ